MHFFERLCNTVDESWRRAEYAEDAFPAIAAEALTAARGYERVPMLDVVAWVHAADHLPVQADLPASFGNPPITVARRERFWIDVNFWVDGTTSIHQHGFAGAFQVLGGASIHSEFAFQETHRYGERLLYGNIERKSLELLRPGDVRTIHAGRQFVHSLFHLDRPSASIVVRTGMSPIGMPQYNYDRPGLAYDYFHGTELMQRRMQTLELLYNIDHPSLREEVAAVVRRSDSYSAFRILNRMFGLVSDAARFQALLEECRESKPQLIGQLDEVFAFKRRAAKITGRRNMTRNADHRFFMALLLNVSSRRGIIDLVRQHRPGQNPADVIAAWVGELAGTAVDREGRPLPAAASTDDAAADARNALGIPVGDTELAVFRLLLDGHDNDGVIERLRKEYDSGEIDRERSHLVELCDAFRGSLLFAPLFTDN